MTGSGPMVPSPVPHEVCAGRLAEAEAESLKGAVHGGSAPTDRKTRRLAGAPEPNQTETEQGWHCRWAFLVGLLSEEGVVALFLSNRAGRAVPRIDAGIVLHAEQSLSNTIEKVFVAPAREVCPPDGACKKGVP